MKKISFKYLYSFKYNNKEYIYLVSKSYPFYFLEYNSSSSSFDYPDINTFKELYNKFYYSENFLSFSGKDNFKNIKKKLSNIEFNFVPLVKTASGFLSIVLVLSLFGCRQIDNVSIKDNTEISSIVNNYDNNEIYNYFKSYNIDIINRDYDGNNYIFVKDFINSDNKHQITIETYEEFRKFKKVDFIPTWDDIIEVFKNNDNIDNDKKVIILDCIDNIRINKELEGIDLSVLYTNAKRMKFTYISSEEMINTINKSSVYAYYDTITGIVYLPSDKPLETFEFIHEVLGHGTLAYREECGDELMVFDCTNYLMLSTDNRYTGYSIGTMISEGGANIIAHLATNDYSVSNFYELYEEELRVIAKLCNVSLGELFNYKGISLYDLMYECGINTPLEYIFKMDGIYKGQMYCEFSDLMERLFVDATEEKFINSNNEEQNEIISSTVEIIRDSYFKDKKELSFNYIGGSINYNFEDSANKYEENMNKLRKN